MNILITGGAGYIGSHISLLIAEYADSVVVLDNISTGHKQAVIGCELVELDLSDTSTVNAFMEERRFDAVIHLAASSLVSESVSNPFKYYSNNTINTINFIQACAISKVKYFIFSSTAAVYGEPDQKNIPITEDCLLKPINPYGRSKLASEWALQDISNATGMKYGILRYFNVSGANRKGLLGESHKPETHLIPLLAKTILGKRKEFSIYGNDYDTPDGTCIRDYIDVEDLASAHLSVLEYLSSGNTSEVFNCGYGYGYSVQQTIDAIEKVAGKKMKLRYSPRREGDPPILIAESNKLTNSTNWRPINNNLDDICQSVLNWEKNAHY